MVEVQTAQPVRAASRWVGRFPHRIMDPDRLPTPSLIRIAELHMIHVIATIELSPGRGEDFLAEFRRLVPQVLAEDGCIEYGPAVDAATGIVAQAPARPDVVTVNEKWASVDHLKRQLDVPHMRGYRERVVDLVTGVTLAILEPA